MKVFSIVTYPEPRDIVTKFATARYYVHSLSHMFIVNTITRSTITAPNGQQYTYSGETTTTTDYITGYLYHTDHVTSYTSTMELKNTTVVERKSTRPYMGYIPGDGSWVPPSETCMTTWLAYLSTKAVNRTVTYNTHIGTQKETTIESHIKTMSVSKSVKEDRWTATLNNFNL